MRLLDHVALGIWNLARSWITLNYKDKKLFRNKSKAHIFSGWMIEPSTGVTHKNLNEKNKYVLQYILDIKTKENNIIIYFLLRRIQARIPGSSRNSTERLKTNVQTLHLFSVSTMHSNCQQVATCLVQKRQHLARNDSSNICWEMTSLTVTAYLCWKIWQKKKFLFTFWWNTFNISYHCWLRMVILLRPMSFTAVDGLHQGCQTHSGAKNFKRRQSLGPTFISNEKNLPPDRIVNLFTWNQASCNSTWIWEKQRWILYIK